MVRAALVDRRPVLLVAIGAAVAFFFLRDAPVGGIWLILLKGMAIASLGLYAYLRHDSSTAKLLALVMFLAAIGDMLAEIDLHWAGWAFLASHLAAISLYLRNLRPDPRGSQKAAAVALLLLSPLASWALTLDTAFAFYGLVLGAMAACAWMSRFSRYRVGLGAVLFVISDLILFASVAEDPVEGFSRRIVWPIYFCGQLLIATGIIQTLRHEIADGGAPTAG